MKPAAVLTALALAGPALAAPGRPSLDTPAPAPTPAPPATEPVPPPVSDASPSPTDSLPPAPSGSDTPPDPEAPPRARYVLRRVWDSGYIDESPFIEGDYVDGWEYADWAWALIYSPANNGTMCLTTYSQGAAANMVAFIAASDPEGEGGSAGAAINAGAWADRTDASCVMRVRDGCVDFLAQWGNFTASKTHTHCDFGNLGPTVPEAAE